MKRIPAGILAFVLWILLFGLSHMLMVKAYEANLETTVFFLLVTGGVALIVVTRRMAPVWQAGLGNFAGLFFWLAFGEVGQAGELWERPGIWGVVFVILVYLFLQPNTRCDLFRWLRKLLGFRNRPMAEINRWHAPSVALSVFLVTWMAHMEELTAYYHPAFGVHSWLTNLTLGVTLAATPFLLYLLWKTRDWTGAWGRAVPSVVIIWMWVEILMKWQVIPKPWG